MRDVRRALFVALAAVVSAACSLLTSTDGLSGGADVADGGLVSRPDGGDANAADTSTTPVDGGDGGGNWCVMHQGDASFCDDFDTQGLAQWQKSERGGGTTTADTAAASSAPASMLSVLPALDGGLSGAFVYRDMKVPVVEVAGDAEFRVEQTNTGSTLLQLMKLLELSPTAVNDELAWEVGVAINGVSRKLVVFQYNYYTSTYTELFTFPTPIAVGEWTRLRLHLRLRGTFDGVVDLDVNGTRVATDLVAQPAFAKAPFQLYAGAIYTVSPHTGWTVRTDNVLFDAR